MFFELPRHLLPRVATPSEPADAAAPVLD
jgi:hypothetical protein